MPLKNNPKFLILLLAVLLMPVMPRAAAKSSPFEIKVEPKYQSVDIYKDHENTLFAFIDNRVQRVTVRREIAVTTFIKNTSYRDQEILVWDCKYALNWTTDISPKIVPVNESCSENEPRTVTLRPRETHSHLLLLGVTDEITSAGRISFRLGFQPVDPEAYEARGRITYHDVETWSHSIDFNIRFER